MANVKISNLTAATTPVAGTEVLPIVQSGATVKVSIANLTAGRSVSATGLALAGSTSGTVTLTAKAVAGSSTFRLPAADGTSNQAMVTDGSGNLSFATIGATPGGSTTQVQYNNAGAFAGSANLVFDGTTLTVASRGIAKGGMPAGSVLQVVSATRSTYTSTTSTSYVTSNLSAAITPTSSSSKIFIMFHAHCSKNGDSGIWLALKRGATQISEFIGNAFFEFNGNMGGSSCSIAYLDSPATTSSTTYEIFFKSQAGTSTAAMFINNVMGTITLMEVAA